jgi:hypothetical protein
MGPAEGAVVAPDPDHLPRLRPLEALATGRQFVMLRPHVVLLPGLAIFVIVLALNLVGDALRDLLDPRTHAA